MQSDEEPRLTLNGVKFRPDGVCGGGRGAPLGQRGSPALGSVDAEESEWERVGIGDASGCGAPVKNSSKKTLSEHQ